jgi:hypothetical protein
MPRLYVPPPRLTFFRAAPPDGLPPQHRDRAARRRTAQLRLAADALDVLPGSGEAIHMLLTGHYDLMHLLVCLIDRLGAVDALRIATLAYSARNLTELTRLLDAGGVKHLTLLCSVFWKRHNPGTWEETVSAFRERGQRVAAARSHAKVVTFSFTSGRYLTLEGSANLRSNGNREQLAMIDGAALHDWHSAWIDGLVAAHEGDGDDAA